MRDALYTDREGMMKKGKVIKLFNKQKEYEEPSETMQWEEFVDLKLDQLSTDTDTMYSYINNSSDELQEIVKKQTARIDELEDRLDKQARALARITEILKGDRLS